MQVLTNYFQAFFHLFFPEQCHACSALLVFQEEFICTKCLFHLPFTQFHKDPNNPCIQQLKGRAPVIKAAAMLHLNASSRVEVLLYHLKYGNKPKVGLFLGKRYAEMLMEDDFLTDIEAFIPIPLHPKKRKWRGYNQTEEFAKGLHQISGIPIYANILKRKVHTKTQTLLSRYERMKNVEGVFEVLPNKLLSDKEYILLDDVLTTGATLSSALETLQTTYPDAKFSVLCIAKA